MNVVVTSETLDLVAFVGAIFALVALGCVVYWEVQRRQQRRRQIARAESAGRRSKKRARAKR